MQKKITISETSTRELKLGDDMVKTETEATSTTELKPPVPDELPKFLFGADLKQIDGYRDIRKSMKIEKLKTEFIEENKKIMRLFTTEQKQYDHKLILYVCQLAEHFFISHKKLGPVKEEAVIEIMKQFFNNDEKLIKSIIQLVMPQIKKSTLRRRMSSRAVKFFYIIGCVLLPK